MPSVTYIEHDGSAHTVDVEAEMTAMEGAQLNMVPGIEAVCGGMCSCATCHCYIEGEWRDKIPSPTPQELAMLDTAKQRRDTSRLACQIILTDELEGLVVHLPQSQGDQ